MTSNQATILHCLRLNVANAPHARKREFAQERLAEYERELVKKWKPKMDNPFTRFEKKLTDHSHD
jgi:hypothetical protein